MHTVSPPKSILGAAFNDLLLGILSWRIWWLLGTNDVRVRYRRSAFGQLWITLSMGLTIGALGFLYSYLFKTELQDYLPFIAVSLIVWTFMAALITESSQTFIAAEGFMKNIALPQSTYAFRVIVRNLLILGHNMIILPVVFFIMGKHVDWTIILFVPAVLLVALNGVWLALALGALATRYRDISQIIASLVQMAFFVSPVIWQPSQLGLEAQAILHYNPFYYFITILRSPLIGEYASVHDWGVAIAITLGVGFVCFATFSRVRSKLVYWL